MQTEATTLEKLRYLTEKLDTTVESNKIDAECAREKVVHTLEIVTTEMETLMATFNGHLGTAINRKLNRIVKLVAEVQKECQTKKTQ